MVMPVLAALFSLACAPARAQTLPDMNRQDAWGPGEKKQFLQYLHSGTSAPINGEVKQMVAPQEFTQAPRKARFATLEFATDTFFTAPGGSRIVRESTAVGPKALVGGHVFSFLRYYGGLEYTRFTQGKVDGTKAGVSHWQFPAGLELALVPLGTPQTRYLLLRGGVALHQFSSSTSKDRFNAPVLGVQTSWNAGLGYEWQLESAPLRLHALAEGYKSMARTSGSPFYGLGFTAGFAYTF